MDETGTIVRPRRLRANALIRDLQAEVSLSVRNLIQPYFLSANPQDISAIKNFTEVNRYGIDPLTKKIESDLERGLHHFLFFGGAANNEKDELGSAGWAEENLVAQTLSTLRKRFGNSAIFYSDVCLCPYTSHGHCGVMKKEKIENDASLTPLANMALVHAQAGADFVAPSDMMDGRVEKIRHTLDQHGFYDTGILAYTAKFHSNYYGPFREALDSSPKLGDRSSYQMDFRNRRESLRELALDLQEGADLVMVKPALAYLDIISDFARSTSVPVVAYSVSGEYEMVKALARQGLADERKLALENLTAIRRAGAQAIITYYATVIAEKRWL